VRPRRPAPKGKALAERVERAHLRRLEAEGWNVQRDPLLTIDGHRIPTKWMAWQWA